MYVVSQGLAFSVSDSFKHLWHSNRSVQTSESISELHAKSRGICKSLFTVRNLVPCYWSLASITSNFWYGQQPSFYMLKLYGDDNIGSTKWNPSGCKGLSKLTSAVCASENKILSNKAVTQNCVQGSLNILMEHLADGVQPIPDVCRQATWQVTSLSFSQVSLRLNPPKTLWHHILANCQQSLIFVDTSSVDLEPFG